MNDDTMDRSAMSYLEDSEIAEIASELSSVGPAGTNPFDYADEVITSMAYSEANANALSFITDDYDAMRVCLAGGYCMPASSEDIERHRSRSIRACIMAVIFFICFYMVKKRKAGKTINNFMNKNQKIFNIASYVLLFLGLWSTAAFASHFFLALKAK